MPTLADLKYTAEIAPYLRQFEQPSLVGISQMQSGNTMGIATPRQQREAQTLRKVAQPVVNAVTDPFYAMTPGVDQRRQDARRRILEKVAAVTTDPMAATFAGAGAKMADKAALARSLEMKAAGVADREIWQQTGWTHGFPDGKPRFELDDSAATFRDNGTRVTQPWEHGLMMDGRPKPFDDFIAHPELEQQYPDNGIGVQVMSLDHLGDGTVAAYGATESMPSGVITLNSDRLPYGGELGKDVKSSTFHELQHAIQERENFAKGGSPDSVATQPDELFKLAQQHNLIGKGLTDGQIKYRLYNSLAGEVEARLTQRRMSLNAQQRRQRYPIDDMDVKPEDQIVRFK